MPKGYNLPLEQQKAILELKLKECKPIEISRMLGIQFQTVANYRSWTKSKMKTRLQNIEQEMNNPEKRKKNEMESVKREVRAKVEIKATFEKKVLPQPIKTPLITRQLSPEETERYRNIGPYKKPVYTTVTWGIA